MSRRSFLFRRLKGSPRQTRPGRRARSLAPFSYSRLSTLSIARLEPAGNRSCRGGLAWDGRDRRLEQPACVEAFPHGIEDLAGPHGIADHADLNAIQS